MDEKGKENDEGAWCMLHCDGGSSDSCMDPRSKDISVEADSTRVCIRGAPGHPRLDSVDAHQLGGLVTASHTEEDGSYCRPCNNRVSPANWGPPIHTISCFERKSQAGSRRYRVSTICTLFILLPFGFLHPFVFISNLYVLVRLFFPFGPHSFFLIFSSSLTCFRTSILRYMSNPYTRSAAPYI